MVSPRAAYHYFCRLAAVAGAVLLALPALAGDLPRRGDLIGRLGTYVVKKGDTLLDVARDFDLGFVELRAANPGIDPWLPPVGAKLVLPTAHLLPEGPREGLVINVPEQRLYYFPRSPDVVTTFPLGTGRSGWCIPLGRTRIVRKRTHPTWIPPPSIRAEEPDLPKVVPPGPENPLGDYALDLGWSGYLIHGTNKPYGIGRRVSHGCIRLYPEDIKRLYRLVVRGTPVTVLDQPVKIGWSGGVLFVEAHPTPAQADEIESTGRFTPVPFPDIVPRIKRVAGDRAGRLDWERIRRAVAERRGVPVAVTR